MLLLISFSNFVFPLAFGLVSCTLEMPFKTFAKLIGVHWVLLRVILCVLIKAFSKLLQSFRVSLPPEPSGSTDLSVTFKAWLPQIILAPTLVRVPGGRVLSRHEQFMQGNGTMAFMVAGECCKESGIKAMEVNQSRRDTCCLFSRLLLLGYMRTGLLPGFFNFQPCVK